MSFSPSGFGPGDAARQGADGRRDDGNHPNVPTPWTPFGPPSVQPPGHVPGPAQGSQRPDDRFAWLDDQTPTAASSCFSSTGQQQVASARVPSGPASDGAGPQPVTLPLAPNTILGPEIMRSVLMQVFGDRRPTGRIASICDVLGQRMGFRSEHCYVRGCLHLHYGPDLTQGQRVSDAESELLDLARQSLMAEPGEPLRLDDFQARLGQMRGAPLDAPAFGQLLQTLRHRCLIESRVQDGATIIRASASASAYQFGAVHVELSPVCRCIEILRKHPLQPGATRPQAHAWAERYPIGITKKTWRHACHVVYGDKHRHRTYPQTEVVRDRTATTPQELQVLALVGECWGYSKVRLWAEAKRRMLGFNEQWFRLQLDSLRGIACSQRAYHLSGTPVPAPARNLSASHRQAVFEQTSSWAIRPPGARLPIIASHMVPVDVRAAWLGMKRDRPHQFFRIDKDDPVLLNLSAAAAMQNAHGASRKGSFYYFDACARGSSITANQLAEQVKSYMATTTGLVRNKHLKKRWQSEYHGRVMQQLCQQGIIKRVSLGYQYIGPPVANADVDDFDESHHMDDTEDIDMQSRTDDELGDDMKVDDGPDRPAPSTRVSTATGSLRQAMQSAPQWHPQPVSTVQAQPQLQPLLPPHTNALMLLCNTLRVSSGRSLIDAQTMQTFMDAQGFTAAHVADPAWLPSVLHAMDPGRNWFSTPVVLKDPLWGVMPKPISYEGAAAHVQFEQPAEKLLLMLNSLTQDSAVLSLGGKPYLIPLERKNGTWYCSYGISGLSSNPPRTVQQVMNDYFVKYIVEHSTMSVPDRLRPEAVNDRQRVHVLTSVP